MDACEIITWPDVVVWAIAVTGCVALILGIMREIRKWRYKEETQ